LLQPTGHRAGRSWSALQTVPKPCRHPMPCTGVSPSVRAPAATRGRPGAWSCLPWWAPPRAALARAP